MNTKCLLLYYARLPLFLLALFLAGCGVFSHITPTTVSTILPSRTDFFPTITPIIMGIATETAIVPLTETPVPTFTPTITATWTPQPTLAPAEAEVLVKNLIATNGGCLLPCWWGITPGITSWEEARSFLETIATSILTLRENLYGVTIKNLPESISEGAIGATIFVKDDIVQTIRTDLFYPLSVVLDVYEQPDEVRIYVDSQSIDALAPFVIALYYEKRGFLAVYRGRTNKGKVVQICPSSIGGKQSVWFLWSPKLIMSFEQAGQQALLFVSPEDRPFRRLEETTNINVRIFYEKFREPQNASMCFQWFDPRQK